MDPAFTLTDGGTAAKPNDLQDGAGNPVPILLGMKGSNCVDSKSGDIYVSLTTCSTSSTAVEVMLSLAHPKLSKGLQRFIAVQKPGSRDPVPSDNSFCVYDASVGKACIPGRAYDFSFVNPNDTDHSPIKFKLDLPSIIVWPINHNLHYRITFQAYAGQMTDGSPDIRTIVYDPKVINKPFIVEPLVAFLVLVAFTIASAFIGSRLLHRSKSKT